MAAEKSGAGMKQSSGTRLLTFVCRLPEGSIYRAILEKMAHLSRGGSTMSRPVMNSTRQPMKSTGLPTTTRRQQNTEKKQQRVLEPQAIQTHLAVLPENSKVLPMYSSRARS